VTSGGSCTRVVMASWVSSTSSANQRRLTHTTRPRPCSHPALHQRRHGHGRTLIVRAFSCCKKGPPFTKPGTLSSPAASVSKSYNSHSGVGSAALGASHLPQLRQGSKPGDTRI
jgi:hypothetical protein